MSEIVPFPRKVIPYPTAALGPLWLNAEALQRVIAEAFFLPLFLQRGHLYPPPRLVVDNTRRAQ